MVTEAEDIVEEYYTRYEYLRQRNIPLFQGMPERKVEKSAEKRLTQAEFQRMRREKKWDFDLSHLPSEAEVATVKIKPINTEGTVPAGKKQALGTANKISEIVPEEKMPMMPIKAEEKSVRSAVFAYEGSPESKRVLEVLTTEPMHISEICGKTGLSTGQILASITELEMEDLVETYAGSHYCLSGTGNF